MAINYEVPTVVVLDVIAVIEPTTKEEIEIACKAFKLGVEFALGQKVYKQEPVLFKPKVN